MGTIVQIVLDPNGRPVAVYSKAIDAFEHISSELNHGGIGYSVVAFEVDQRILIRGLTVDTFRE